MGFSRQEYWNELPCPAPGALPDPGTEPASPAFPALQADSLPTEPSLTVVTLNVSGLNAPTKRHRLADHIQK